VNGYFFILCFIKPENIPQCFHQTASGVIRERIFPVAAFVWSSRNPAWTAKITNYNDRTAQHCTSCSLYYV